MKGKKNTTNDTLFRNTYFYSLSSISIDWKMNIMVEYVTNEFAQRILDGKVKNGKYIVRDGLILKKTKFSWSLIQE